MAGCKLVRILKWHTHIYTSITLVMLKYCLHGMQYLFIDMLIYMLEFFTIGTISHSQFLVCIPRIYYVHTGKQSKHYFCPIKCCTNKHSQQEVLNNVNIQISIFAWLHIRVFPKFDITVACGLKFHWYLRSSNTPKTVDFTPPWY